MKAPQGINLMVLDTETTGVHRSARITQLAFMVINLDGYIVDEFQSLVKPDGWEVPKEQFFIDNNMSTERCEAYGYPIRMILRRFQDALKGCKYKVAHNMRFDKARILYEMELDGITKELFKFKPSICTMNESRKLRIGKRGGNAPSMSLNKLHKFLFNEEFDGSHDAMNDVRATAKCLLKMIKDKHINLNK